MDSNLNGPMQRLQSCDVLRTHYTDHEPNTSFHIDFISERTARLYEIDVETLETGLQSDEAGMHEIVVLVLYLNLKREREADR
jgi:hypothetical protein